MTRSTTGKKDDFTPPHARPAPCWAPAWPAKVKLSDALARPIAAEFIGERVIGRSWPAAENHLSVLELTY